MNKLFASTMTALIAASLLSFTAHAAPESTQSPVVEQDSANVMDELNPFDPNIEEILKKLDAVQEAETGMPSHISDEGLPLGLGEGLPQVFIAAQKGCYQLSCKVWAQVDKSDQALYIYVDGVYVAGYLVSTGVDGFLTPNFDKHPDGRIYDKYTSTKYPEGDYKGLGNMPYAVFISGGFAIHGTTTGNIKKLGKRASHGCIRVHPDVGYYFNRLVRQAGVRNVWVTVQP